MLLNRGPLAPAIIFTSIAALGTIAQNTNLGVATVIGTSKQAAPTPEPTSKTNAKPIDTPPGTTPQAPSSSIDDGALMSMPTLTGGFTIVAPSVPPTQNAPYLQQSTLPEGTVFIVVGAVLGFFAVSILAWRMGNAWRLHRSVQRAALNQGMADTKALFRTTTGPSAPFYKYSDRESSVSLPVINNKGTRRASKPGTAPPSANSTSNLFFSPTAGAAGANHGSGSNRGSTYFPAGFYSAGPGNGNSQGGAPAISLTNLNSTQNYARQRSMDLSPPDTQQNLNQVGGANERAPSAYLDHLFNGENISPLTQQNHHRQNSGTRNYGDAI
ncbi:hypothetical protein K3495_g4140 [Podosphaera aphanis]|nr:hypothetical protein K3495_g4140 [Podosphaera aphanis]